LSFIHVTTVHVITTWRNVIPHWHAAMTEPMEAQQDGSYDSLEVNAVEWHGHPLFATQVYHPDGSSVSQHEEDIVFSANKGWVDLPDERILGPLGLASIIFFEVKMPVR